MDLREKLELVIEMAPRLRAAGVQGRIETEEIDFTVAPPEVEVSPATEERDPEERRRDEDEDDPHDLRPKAVRERTRNQRGF